MKRSFIALLLLAAALPSLAQSPSMRARVEGLVTAFNSPPEQFEQYAKEAYAPELYNRGTAERRRQFLERVQTDFGRLEATTIRRDAPERITISVTGAKGTKGTLTVEHEVEAPHRITNLGFRLGEEEPAAPLPPLPIDGRMPADELSNALDAWLVQLAKADRFAGTILVARDGKPLFEKSYGLANRSDHIANTPQTRFNIGSINKHLTRTAIGQLIGAGKLSASDTIAKHLPDYPNANARNVTLQQLLDMTAGLADFFGPDFDSAPKHRFRRNRDYYQFVAPKPLNFEPGSRKQYCNSCYIVLGEIVERLSGMPYEQYVADNIFRRAAMSTAAFLQADQIAPNVAIGYSGRDGELRSNVLMRGAGGSAAGAAYTTARDLLALDEALRNGRLVDPQWFFGPEYTGGRARVQQGYAGGSTGINAGVASDGTWTVIALANLDPPAAEALSEAIYSRLLK